MSQYADQSNDPKRRRIIKNIIAYFSNVKRVEPLSYFKNVIERFKATKREEIIQKSMSKIDRQLDLVKFMRNMRMQRAALVGYLNTNQKMFVRKLSRIVVHESTSETGSSSNSVEVQIDPEKLHNTFEK